MMTNQCLKFAVVIPMYNEEVGAKHCIDTVCKELSKIPVTSKLIIVEDGSRDSTKSILKNIEPNYSNLEVFYHPQNSGYGAALRTGAKLAYEQGFDYVLFMDSDLTNDPADIPKFLEKMERGIDVIKATRYSDGGAVQGVPFYRVLISRVGNLLATVLFRIPIYDCTNGFRAVKTALLNKIELRENNFSIIMEELYKLKPFVKTYARVPVILTNRANDLRPTSFAYRPSIFRDYLKYPLRDFFRIKPTK